MVRPQARNEEKAQSMLYRFREAQAAEMGLGRRFEKRPASVNMVQDFKEADRWRGNLIREIGRKVAKIQDSTLTEFAVRDLNDHINKLLKEKRAWENRIKELGGPDYRKSAPRLMGDDGIEVPGSRGYRYFGRARDLPGVKELFQKEETEETPVQRGEMRKRVDADYYGYRDEDDGRLVAYEALLERRALRGDVDDENDEGDPMVEDDAEDEESPTKRAKRAGAAVLPDEHMYLTRVDIPTKEDVEAWLLRRRKQELADRFLGETADTGKDEENGE
ncbi:NineTeen Complex (NTC) component [Irineochytrium annulatum]|nr:NineTeen Complex (NTC) component [Irineochytrium annulatum]